MAILLEGVTAPLGDAEVIRLLPNFHKKMVGPFIFLDRFGPIHFAAGEGIDVGPHPHIGLATITYLLEGEQIHRDSLGNEQTIYPGDINIMTAGSGIVHSEREPDEVKSKPHTIDGVQIWVALPKDKAEVEPSFAHVSKQILPHINRNGVLIDVLVGKAFGEHSPAPTYSSMFYLSAKLEAGALLQRPNPEHECAVYILDGQLDIGSVQYTAGDLVLLESESLISAVKDTHCLMLGGEQWEETPRMMWNFVAFEKDRLLQAKEDWQAGRFPTIASDSGEPVAFPEKK